MNPNQNDGGTAMILFALLFVSFFVVLVGVGIFIHVYMYANGAFDGKIRRGRMPPLDMVSLGQTATMPTSAAAADLYTGRHERMSVPTLVFILYSLGILLTLVVLIVLVLGTTHF
jgi:hypothetical protein